MKIRAAGSRKWLCVVLIFVLGLTIRLALVLVSGIQDMERIGQGMEPVRIALSLLNKGIYGDSYGDNIGPTAHCLPMHPLILAALIWLFGEGAAGSMAIHMMASAAASLGYALLPLVAERWRLGEFAGVAAGLFGALLPVNFWTQTSGVFDAPLTFLGLVLLFLSLGQYWFGETFPIRGAIIFGLIGGLVGLLNASVLPVLFAWGVLGVWRFQRQKSVFIRFQALVACVVFFIFGPWVIRNWFAFGELILTRSNFGLELRLSNNDLSSGDVERDIRTPGSFIHPLANSSEREKVRSMGEIQYHAEQRQKAVKWIRENPERFAQLTFTRIKNFWFPPMARWWQSMVEWTITVGGVFGLIVLARKRHETFWVMLTMLLSYSAIHTIIQVSPRYRFPVEPFLLLLCFYGLGTLWRRAQKIE